MFKKVLTATALAIALAVPSGVIAATVKQGGTLVGDVGGIVSTGGTSVLSSNGAYDNSLTTPTSQWVWPTSPSGPNSASYQFVFDLTGFDVSTASLSGLWGVDNTGSVLLNGTQIAALPTVTTANFNSLNPYGTSDTSLFLSGNNVLQFDLADAGGQAAFRATASVEATVIPLPAAGVLLLLGIGGLAGVRRLSRA